MHAPRTTENGSVNCEEAVLQSLLKVSTLECLLFGDDIVKVVASVQSDLVTSVAIIDTEIADALVRAGRLQLFITL